MANREVTATLKIQSKLGSMAAFEQARKKIREVERQTGAFNRTQAALSKTMASSESALLAYGKTAGALAIGAGFVGVAKSAADYESRLAGIQKKLGGTAEEAAKLGDEARKLATSGELAMPLEEILSAYERGAAAGLPLDDLREFARLSATAADGFEMSAEDVGNAAAGFKVSMGVPIAEMERYFDLINGLADSGIADERDIVKFLDNAAAPLRNLGLAKEDVAALGSTLLNLKLPADVAARAMGTLSTKLLTPEATKPSRAAFKELYGSADKFTDLLKKDARGALIDFLKRVRELDKFKQADILSKILGQGFSDEVQRLAGGMDELIKNFDYVDSKDWFGSLSNAYQIKLKTMESQWQLFKNQVGELAIDVGMRGMPAMKAGLEGAKKLVEEIDHGLENFHTQIDMNEFDAASAAVGDLATKIGELLNLNTSGSSIGDFFRDTAKIVNDISTGINSVARGIEIIREGISNPSSLLEPADVPYASIPDAMKEENGGFVATPWDAAQRRSARRAAENRRNAQVLSDRDLSERDFLRGDGLVSEPKIIVEEDRDTRFNAASVPPPGRGGRHGAAPAAEWPDITRHWPTTSVLPTPSRNPRSLPDTMDLSGTISNDVDALRNAMSDGGRDAGRSVADAADRLQQAGDQAARAIEDAGTRVARELSSLTINARITNPGSGGAPARNLGPSMPNAGSPSYGGPR
ncbi:phage tail tape measure protein [Mesorhizobium sp. RP14(2022)]|uniref:Phage tail tape measure protein n=1 Tax=Mesorhizobium liriopis TaxID=2953882 RepID=A0ABT1C719_9HYPH|nr:phage tail tape measure protein [Mesorhizobium liriopis]MCO6050629.1 phage tail tape measure protein [Mesorhizobium liriopis]